MDANHNEIVDALRAAGCSVTSLAECGNGVPDLLVGTAGHNICMEVKDGSLVPSARLLTPKQKLWHREWRGTAHVVESVEQALAIVQHYRNGRSSGR